MNDFRLLLFLLALIALMATIDGHRGWERERGKGGVLVFIPDGGEPEYRWVR